MMNDNMAFDPSDIAKIRQMQGLGPLQASNQAVGVPMQSFDEMPSPLERAPSEDAPGLSVPPPRVARAPAGPPKPTPADDGGDLDLNDGAAGSDGDSPLKDLMVTKDDLESANRNKKQLMALGMIGDALANNQTAGNFYIHQMNPHHDVQGFAQKMADFADAPIEQKKILLKQALTEPDSAMKIAAGNPTSSVSRIASAAAQAYAQKNGMKADDFKGKSLLEINAVAPGVMEALGKENAMLQHYKIMADLAGRRLDQGDQRIAMGKDNQTTTAANVFDKDSLSTTLQARKNQIEMDRHTLETSDVIPPQIMDEMSAGLASALAGGKGAGLEQTKMQQLGSLEKDIAKAKSYAAGKPYNALTDDQRQFLQSTFTRLGNAYDQVMDARRAQLRKGRNYSANPAANAAMDTKAAPTAAPVDQGMVQMRDPKGNIRSVRADQVEAAKAAGGVVTNGGL